MMAWLQLWTMGLMAAVALSISPAEDSGLPVVEALQLRPVGIVKKESHPILFRQKREWIWNNLFVEEEKPTPNAHKIGHVGSGPLKTKTPQQAALLCIWPTCCACLTQFRL